ncbi:MAG TPA: glycosyltransferase, partial [Acidimicrobiales bacterium]|nr:glycosyltransferase [Acidimicrobiales bacterium]
AGDEELRTEHDVPRTRIGRMAEVVVGRDRRLADREHEVAALRRSLAIPPGAVVLTSFAVAAVHDPPELCVTLVSRLRERVGSTQLCLVWVVPPDRERLWIVHDLERTGLAGLVRVVEAEVPLPPYVEMSDLMVHASRSPQHPLAYLDAAALGVPIVCFEHHDLAELVGADEGGAVCRSLDVVEMADRLAELVADPCRRARAGAAAADRVRERNGVEGAADRLWQQIEAAT